VIIAIGGVAGLVLISYLLEASRRAPSPPERLGWAPDIPIRSITVDGVRLRYIVAGDGPPLVLLHTLRTQLDMFQHIVPQLAGRFKVYALDYPGHGYSDIPNVTYSAEYFVGVVAAFLDQLQIRNALVVGESIGGSIALLLAARQHPAVARVLAVNPYDYDGGRGLRRASLLSSLLFGVNDVPVLGATVARLRLFPIVRAVFEGGVERRGALSPALARELYRVGNRPGHYQAFMSLVRHWPSWERARAEYGKIGVPVPAALWRSRLVPPGRAGGRRARHPRRADAGGPQCRALSLARRARRDPAGGSRPLDRGPDLQSRHLRQMTTLRFPHHCSGSEAGKREACAAG